MALFFNLQTLEAQSENNATQFMSMLEYHWNKRLPKNARTKLRPSKVPLHGGSFLLNPESLFRDSGTDILYKLQYVKLAARRDWGLYKQYKYKGLQRSYYPDLLIDAIRSNPLLEITGTEINFKYE